jgi:hypothetical protein
LPQEVTNQHIAEPKISKTTVPKWNRDGRLTAKERP